MAGEGPDSQPIIIHARTFLFQADGIDRAVRLSAAINKSEIDEARNAFASRLAVALSMLAAALLAASLAQIFFGLRPLGQIRDRVNAVRTGAVARLEGEFPSEVQHLVAEVNALLGANDQAVRRARDSAADLAHGLKTPLAILQAESRALHKRGETNAAQEIEAQIEQMRGRIERHLANVRMRGASPGRHRANIAESADKLVRAMKTIPPGDTLQWRVDIPNDLNVGVDAEDLLEVLGNILDNARKWARSAVTISAKAAGETRIAIDDDGPGVPPALREQVRQRGKRLDEIKSGAGLGLSIAERILNSYGGTLVFGEAPGGGARIAITLPLSV